MAGYQSLTLVGNVGRSPEFNYTESGIAVCSFNVAVNRTWTKDGEKREEVTWFRVTCWRGLAEVANEFVTKGMQVLVVGSIGVHVYMSRDEEPEPRAQLEVTAQTLQFLGSRSSSEDDDDYEDHEEPFD